MDQFETVEEIGSGAFGKVSKVKRKTDGKLLVWKELNFGNMSKKEKEMLVSEVNILRELRHPHIVRYYNHIIDSQRKKIYIVMEYCDGGDLRSLIKKHEREGTKVDEEVVWRILTQLAIALKECHDRRIIHRDIKPANVLLDSHMNVKLGDFGLARILSENSYARTHVGTPLYLAPELTRDETYDTKADVWSLGCVLYELCAQHPPFSATNHVALALKIRTGKYLPLDGGGGGGNRRGHDNNNNNNNNTNNNNNGGGYSRRGYTTELAQTIGGMLKVGTTRRISMEDLLRVPHVRLKLRERRLNQHYNLLKRKEEELSRREREVAARERRIQEQEKVLERNGYQTFSSDESHLTDGRPIIPRHFSEDKENRVPTEKMNHPLTDNRHQEESRSGAVWAAFRVPTIPSQTTE